MNLEICLSLVISCFEFLSYSIFSLNFLLNNPQNIIKQIIIIGPRSLPICLLTACFVGLVFTLQVVKEFLYLDATNIVGAILTLAFVRELSPVLTAVIITARVSSSFTSEIATMKITDQIDALYILNVNPLLYIVYPRILASVISLPVLNFISLFTSLASSIFICFTLYGISPIVFLYSVYDVISISDISKSLLKAAVFGLILSLISCVWGLNTVGGAKSVGYSTTSSVVTILLTIFIIDFTLSYFMFHKVNGIINYL